MSMSATPIAEGKSRQRLRTEKNALRYLDESLKLPPSRRRKARIRVRSAKQPIREARRVVSQALIPSKISGHDQSDVQELRVRLLRRDLILCPEQVDWLRRLDTGIAKGQMGKQEFEKEAIELLKMSNSLPLTHRKAEYEYQRESIVLTERTEPASGNGRRQSGFSTYEPELLSVVTDRELRVAVEFEAPGQ